MLLILVRLGFFGFEGENPPTVPPFTGSRGRDLPLTVTSVGSAGSRVGSKGFYGWVRYRFSVDSPNHTTHTHTKDATWKLQHSKTIANKETQTEITTIDKELTTIAPTTGDKLAQPFVMFQIGVAFMLLTSNPNWLDQSCRLLVNNILFTYI